MLKPAKYNYGEKVKIKFYEAGIPPVDCIIVGISMTDEFSPPVYEVKEINELGELEAGSITDIDEEMIK